MRFRIHYSQADVERELERFAFPGDFDMGTSTAGYQVEGALNGPADPKNNWYWAEWKGEKERTGDGCRFLELYADDWRRAQAIGCNAARMGIEWARLQPRINPGDHTVPDFSGTAARRYAEILAAAYDHGMFPAVTLHHFTNPLWAGLDFWLDRQRVKDLFVPYVDWSVRTINRILTGELGKPPIPYFITVNEPIVVPYAAYLLRVFPRGPGSGGWADALTAYENILIGHVLAYRTIHRVYAEQGWPRPTVTANGICLSLYGADKLAQDLWVARQAGVERSRVAAYLADQRSRFLDAVGRVPPLDRPRSLKRGLDRLLDWAMWRRMRRDPLPHLCDLIWDGDEPVLADALSFDYYDPFVGNNVDLGRVRVQPWDWHVNPRAIGTFLDSYSWNAGDLPIHLLENGMCYRGVGTRHFERLDGARRIDVLKATFFEILRSLNRGVPLRTYYYWSLIDNYEWGSFEPRFGLFAVDYEHGARRLPTDIAGDNAAGAYSLFVRGMREKDKDALRAALLSADYPELDLPG